MNLAVAVDISLPVTRESTLLVTEFSSKDGTKYALNGILTDFAYASIAGKSGVKLIDVESTEILNAAQVILSRSGLEDLLVIVE